MNSKILRIFTYLVIGTGLLSSCSPSETSEKKLVLAEGIWRATIEVQSNELPFNFELVKRDGSYEMIVHNADERLKIDDIAIKGDSIFIPMHIFDADIKATITENTITGYWTKNYEDDYSLQFKAVHGESHRFAEPEGTPQDFNGRWATTFDHEGDTTIGIGIFNQSGNQVTGTFLTPTGDYRYLEGIVDGNKMSLSTFDGGHAFVFIARKNDDNTLSGDFWSGKTWHETWTAINDETAELPNADSLTYIKEGYDKLTFSFPDLDGNMVSPEKYQGKVLILQIFGTWCPNCMDETKFLTKWYDENKDRGVEILGLDYEAKDDFDYAKKRLLNMKNKWNVNYDFVVAGTKDKDEASKTLPMLNKIISFPTTIFLDKNGDVARIHTGFTGPGTGLYYDQFVKEFNETVDKLLEE